MFGVSKKIKITALYVTRMIYSVVIFMVEFRYKFDKFNWNLWKERISSIEYIEFLKRTDLGSQYPKERFEERIAKLVDHVSISLVARNRDNHIVGILFGLTDYAYWLYVTDLGVDRDYLHQGIGTELTETAHSLADGKNDVAVYLVANENAISFYEKL